MSFYIQGTYQKSIFESDKGYYIGLFKIQETTHPNLEEKIGKTITFTGYFHELNHMDTYRFYGNMVNHPRYGEQFQVESYERCIPEQKDQIVTFLSGGLFKGIGEKKAKSIVDVLGKKTLKVILKNPDDLILIPGITEKNIQVLHQTLLEYESSYEIIMELNKLGFSTKDAMTVYRKYKQDTQKIIEGNFYQLIEDIYEMNFKKIDAIFMRNGGEKTNPNRVKAAILYIMQEISNTYGHCYYHKEEILVYLPRVLDCMIEEEKISTYLSDLEKDLKIIVRGEKYYLKEMVEAETLIVKRIRILMNEKEEKISKPDEILKDLEEHFGIQYNDKQKESILKSIQKNFLIITGGPGTGKTTIMKGICELYRLHQKYNYGTLMEKIALLAPTGRAAKRMSEATSLPASTIHRFLKWNKETDQFQVNEFHKSKVEFVILDESSMVDTYLMAHLLRGLSVHCKIVLVGDDHQLPSVGPGNVLHDLIESKKCEVIELTELYRQGKDSNIISLAYDIRNGKINESIFNQEEDLSFISCSKEEVMNQIGEIASTYQDIDKNTFQILAPMYKGMNGIDEINRNIQKIWNPSKQQNEYKVGDVLFKENDKVIQLTNMPDDNVYNGDIGFIQKIYNGSKKEIHIDFDGNVVKYTPSNFHNFRQAYAISIHKSQGSEFDIVLIPLVKEYKKMLYQKLIYTAVTRSKKKLYFIGEMEALKFAASNTQEEYRKTTIQDYFIHGID